MLGLSGSSKPAAHTTLGSTKRGSAHPYMLATDSRRSSAAGLRLPVSKMTTPSTSAERGRATLVEVAAAAALAATSSLAVPRSCSELQLPTPFRCRLRWACKRSLAHRLAQPLLGSGVVGTYPARCAAILAVEAIGAITTSASSEQPRYGRAAAPPARRSAGAVQTVDSVLQISPCLPHTAKSAQPRILGAKSASELVTLQPALGHFRHLILARGCRCCRHQEGHGALELPSKMRISPHSACTT